MTLIIIRFILVILSLLIIMTTIEAIEKFHRKLIITKRPATVSYYQFYFKLIHRYLGNHLVKALDEEQILNFIILLKTHHPNMKNITINKALSALKTICKYGANHPIIISRLSETKKLIPLIPESTIAEIFFYLQSRVKNPHFLRNYLIVKILLETGLRMNELIHLSKTGVDLENQTIFVVITKTNQQRIVCFKKDTVTLLSQWIGLHPDVPYLFYNLTTFQQMTTTSIESMFYQIKKRLKIKENITPHKWRHTFATQFLRRGGDLETLRMLLGHSNLKTTQKYLHLNHQDIRQQYRQIMDKEVNK
jgi:integrase/recombinase XerD